MLATGLSGVVLILTVCAARGQDFDNRHANTANAVRVVEEVFSKGDTSVISNLYDKEYQEYAPDMPQGLQELFDFVEDRRDAGLLVPLTVKHTVAEEDFVLVHAHAGEDPAVEVSGNATTELFRFGDDGKIIAHWGNREVVPRTTKSGATMFSDLYEFPEGHVAASTQEEMDANKEVAAAAVDAAFNSGDLEEIDGLYQETFWNHIPGIGHGIVSYKHTVANFPEGRSARVWLVMAEGDLVFTVSEIKLPAADEDEDIDGSLHGLYLIVGGLIVERWSVFQETTPANETLSGNSVFGGLPGGLLGEP